MAIFAFCIISTFTSLLEIVQIVRDTYLNRLTSLFGQITNCLSLWLEDVPLLTLNLLLVICHDGEVTYISLTKAIIGIVAALLRSLSIVLNKWLIRHDYERKDHLSQFFNTISTAGVIFVFILSTSIHIIASLPIDNYGRIHLVTPSDFQQFKFAHQKYFHDVGLFVQSPNDIDGYIYLSDIEHIIANSSTHFTYSINEKDNVFCLKQINQSCFMQLNDSTIVPYDSSSINDRFINYSLIFEFKHPDTYYQLGDIVYNIVRCDFKNFYIADEKFPFRYFQYKSMTNETRHMLQFNRYNDTYRFYNSDMDFLSIENLWKTGLSRCSSTSSFSPHRSQEIYVDHCS